MRRMHNQLEEVAKELREVKADAARRDAGSDWAAGDETQASS